MFGSAKLVRLGAMKEQLAIAIVSDVICESWDSQDGWKRGVAADLNVSNRVKIRAWSYEPHRLVVQIGCNVEVSDAVALEHSMGGNETFKTDPKGCNCHSSRSQRLQLSFFQCELKLENAYSRVKYVVSQRLHCRRHLTIRFT